MFRTEYTFFENSIRILNFAPIRFEPLNTRQMVALYHSYSYKNCYEYMIRVIIWCLRCPRAKISIFISNWKLKCLLCWLRLGVLFEIVKLRKALRHISVLFKIDLELFASGLRIQYNITLLTNILKYQKEICPCCARIWKFPP